MAAATTAANENRPQSPFFDRAVLRPLAGGWAAAIADYRSLGTGSFGTCGQACNGPPNSAWIDDIRRARTIPAAAYTDAALFERIRDRVFARCWQIAADRTEVRTPRLARPFTFLEGLIRCC